MKKIITLFVALAATSASFAAEPADSLGYLLGNTQGALINQQLSKNFIHGQKYRNSLVRGLEIVFSGDTTDIGYFEGLEMGLRMFRDMVQVERLGGKVNRADLFEQLSKGILATDIDQEALKINRAKLQALLEPLQLKAEEMQRQAQARERAVYDSIATRNENAGKAFIDSIMAADKSIKKTESGLAYKVINPGKGKNPTPADKLDVIYTGKHIDGSVFDSSDGKPVQFGMGGVIQGFGEGLGMMKKGAKYILYIPGELGYGKRGTGNGVIMPGETLVFEVELADIKK